MECNHYFLKEHWEDYLTAQIEQYGASPFIKCMAHQCNMIIPNSQIQEFVPEYLFKKNQ